MSPSDEALSNHNKNCLLAFMASSAIRRAHNTIVTELRTRCAISILEPQLERIIRELHMYGYVVYKRARNTIRLFSGSDVKLKLNVETQEITPIPIGDIGMKTSGWKCVVLIRPLFTKDGRYICADSPVRRTINHVNMINSLLRNALTRDAHNRDPAVYTKISSKLSSVGADGHTFFHKNASQILPSDVVGAVNMNALVRNRAEAMAKLDTVSDSMRKRKAEELDEIPRTHQEHIISDGNDITPVSHLNQDPTFLNGMLSRLEDEIFFEFQVPPQAIGKNINSERQAGASRLSEVALVRWERHLRKLGNTVALVYMSLDIPFKFQPYFSLFDIHQAETILKTDVAAKMYAGVFGVSEEDIDYERLAKRQDILIGGDLQTAKKPEEEKTEARTARDSGS